MTEENSFRKLVAETLVGSLQAPKHMIVVKSSYSPYEGFKTLVDNNILAAPVLDEKTNKFTGFLDIRDLVSFVVFVDDDQKSDVPQNLHELIMHGCKLFKAELDGVTVTYLSRRNPFHQVSTTDSLLKVCEDLSKGLHRVPVVDQQGKLVNIISQSSIISFLSKHEKTIKSQVHQTLGELNLGTKPVISVKQDTPAIDTFRLMDKKKISGVAVVDNHGRFVGNTSASDLKLFMRTLSLDILARPTMEFLKIIRQESIEIKSPTISVSTHDTLAVAISKLASTKIHKLFVADDQDGYKPLAVVSLTDILRYLLKK
jgi:CBS domain-containing protein